MPSRPVPHDLAEPARPLPPTYEPRPFRPARWLPGPHMQTLGGRALRPAHALPLRRERLETPDGDFLDLDFGPDARAGAPVVLVLHGLEGSSQRTYMRLTYRALSRAGLLAVGLNFRSCSGQPNRLPRFYHSGDTEDLAWVLEVLGRRLPGRPRAAVGFSLGGNVLLKLLGERGDGARSLLQAAVAISVPFDLAAGSAKLERGPMGQLYTRYFLRMLKRKWRAKRRVLEGLADMAAMEAARTLREFDDVATAPLHGFRDAADYYERSSSAPYLGAVRLPTLLLQSRDDPFLPPDAIPEAAIAGNPWLVPAFAERGGHVGFVEGPGPWAPSFWAEEEAARFLVSQLGAPEAPLSGGHG